MARIQVFGGCGLVASAPESVARSLLARRRNPTLSRAARAKNASRLPRTAIETRQGYWRRAVRGVHHIASVVGPTQPVPGRGGRNAGGYGVFPDIQSGTCVWGAAGTVVQGTSHCSPAFPPQGPTPTPRRRRPSRSLRDPGVIGRRVLG